jgi:hypothetical protein
LSFPVKDANFVEHNSRTLAVSRLSKRANKVLLEYEPKGLHTLTAGESIASDCTAQIIIKNTAKKLL